jgi:hypothetical protein
MYHYELDGYSLERFNTKTEKFKRVAKCADDFTALNRAKADFARLRNLHPSAQAKFYCADRSRIDL